MPRRPRREHDPQREVTGRRCGRCGRALSDPASSARGYGPTCWARLLADAKRAVGGARS